MTHQSADLLVTNQLKSLFSINCGCNNSFCITCETVNASSILNKDNYHCPSKT